MKINKKLILISTALLAVSPIAVAPLTSNVQTSVAAATKSNATGSLKVIDSHVMLYNRSGNYLDHISAPKKGSTIKYKVARLNIMENHFLRRLIQATTVLVSYTIFYARMFIFLQIM